MILVRFRAWLMGSVYTAGAIAAVFRNGDEVLLVKPRYRRGWGLPGGFLKHGEQASDTVRREMLEETGIAIDVDRAHEVYVQPGRRHLDHLFVLEVNDDTDVVSRASAEIAAAKWFHTSKLPELQREAHEALRRLRDG